MQLNSPIAEHIQLNTISTLKSNLLYNSFGSHQLMNSPSENEGSSVPVNNKFSGSIDTVIEGPSFPSPPQSPKINSYNSLSYLVNSARKYESIDEISENVDVIKVTPTWSSNQGIYNYINDNRRFLSQYRLGAKSMPSKKLDARINKPVLDSTLKPRRRNGNDTNKFETRQSLKRHTRSLTDDDDTFSDTQTYSPILSRKSHHHSVKHNHHNNSIHYSGFSKPRTPKVTSHSQNHTTPNVDWENLPDYSPSYDMLPSGNNKCLKVEWKGSHMDLSSDPLRYKLHPAELYLAQILRLPCNLFLDSKKRLFMSKVERLRSNLPFRRTDAQKACRIDVNKASRLFSAFEKVGWLKDSNFTKYL